jgi:hypothetical protein
MLNRYLQNINLKVPGAPTYLSPALGAWLPKLNFQWQVEWSRRIHCLVPKFTWPDPIQLFVWGYVKSLVYSNRHWRFEGQDYWCIPTSHCRNVGQHPMKLFYQYHLAVNAKEVVLRNSDFSPQTPRHILLLCKVALKYLKYVTSTRSIRTKQCVSSSWQAWNYKCHLQQWCNWEMGGRNFSL